MRVTHVITRLIIGGAQENTLSTVAGLRQFPGLEVSLISGPTTGPEGSLEAEARRALGEQHFISIPGNPVSRAVGWIEPLQAQNLGTRSSLAHRLPHCTNFQS